MGDRPSFSISDRRDPGGSVRLALYGELDLATAPVLATRLVPFGCARSEVTLDLSELRFIDSSGLDAILSARRDAAEGGWRLGLARNPSARVLRLTRLLGVSEELWPEGIDGRPRLLDPATQGSARTRRPLGRRRRGGCPAGDAAVPRR